METLDNCYTDKNPIRNDRTDWEQEVHRLLPRVLSFFLYKVKSREDAEDLCAEVFEKVWKKRGSYKPEKGSIDVWVMSIARNKRRDFFKKQKSGIRVQGLGNFQIEDHYTEEEREKNEQKEMLRSLLGDLDAVSRDLIALRYGAGMTLKATGEILGMSESNVGTRLHRLVKVLRKRWEKIN